MTSLQAAPLSSRFFLNAKLYVVSTFVDIEAVVKQNYISDMLSSSECYEV